MTTQVHSNEPRGKSIRHEGSARLRRRFSLRPLVLSLTATSLLSLSFTSVKSVQAQTASQALPTGLNVVHGQAQVVVNGQQMTVINSANSILDWQSFSIGSTHGVHFTQPGAESQVLNRVLGNDPSAIFGSLSSNGKVWLLNPNGVLFGQGARVDVGGLVTSTLRLNNVDWLNGRYNFNASSGDPVASVVNQGELRSSLGGRIALLGGSVRNEGLIDAPEGQVLLAAGHSIDLVDTGSPNLRLRVTAPQGEVLNLGTLAAAGARIDVHAAVVNQQGIVRADSLGLNAAGEIVLQATDALNLAAGSLTRASGATGGEIRLDSGATGTTLVQGDVLATGGAGAGGQIVVLGSQVGLAGAANLDVSGRSGGEVLVGGGQRGQDPAVTNSRAVFIGAEASINANAVGSGDGGRIILWSNEATRAYGSLSARGGDLGGNGGFIETSGGWFDVRLAKLDAAAPSGLAGTWLLDPWDILITNSDDFTLDAGNTTDPVVFAAVGSPSRIFSGAINQALSRGQNVVVETGSTGSENGDITVENASIGLNSPQIPAQVSLTLQAARNINISGSTVNVNGLPGSRLSLILNASSGDVSMQSSSVDTNGGRFEASGVGINVSSSSVVAGVIRLYGDSVTLGTGTTIESSAAGDAIIVAGRNGINNTTSFVNNAGVGALVVRSDDQFDRWLIYGRNPAQVDTGGLVTDFVQFDTRFGDESSPAVPETGNGVLYSDPVAVAPSTPVSPPPIFVDLAPSPLLAPNAEWSSPSEGRVLDVLPALSGSRLEQGAVFNALPVDEMSQDALTGLLAARDRYKKALFADAIRQLEQTPTLADVPACINAKQVESGECLVTEELKQQLRDQRKESQARQVDGQNSAGAASSGSSPEAEPPRSVASPRVDLPSVAPAPDTVLVKPAPLFTRSVRSAALPQIERKIAVVIGIDRYADRRIPQLDNAVADAKAIGRTLEEKLGYETLVLENADKSAVVRTLNRLAVELESKDSVVIYYAGHGELVKPTGIGYWQLSDSNPTRPESWMSNADISRMIGRISADQVALISDSCYSGSLVDERIRGTTAPADPQQLLSKKTVVVMSSGGNEPVFDDGKNGHSPFAYNLMLNLEKVSSWQVGSNVFERVRFGVARQLPQRPLYGSASAAGHQPGGDYLFEQRQLDRR